MTEDLRLYTFVNFYLSSIQQGIQSAHVVHSLFEKYGYTSYVDQPRDLLWDWAKNHKTMIVLNGGINADLHAIYLQLSRESVALTKGPLPFECFCEDEASLGGVMTAVGVVVPACYYDAVNYRAMNESEALTVGDKAHFSSDGYFYLKDGLVLRYYPPDTPDHRFITLLKSKGLAR